MVMDNLYIPGLPTQPASEPDGDEIPNHLRLISEMHPHKQLSDWSMMYRDYLGSMAWSLKRLQILARDNFQCQSCGSEYNLQAHHLSYSRIFRERPNDLVTLCRTCHQNLHANH